MIVSFYSYKGGVGRTQLVANLAAYLCYFRAKKILLLDWDLEAPGLHYYFNKSNNDILKNGLIELFKDYCNIIQSGFDIDEKKLPYFTNDNIENLIKSSKGDGVVDLIPAGNYNKDYIKNINSFNWEEFYDNLDGKTYIEYLKKELRLLNYDYIFIDSRTGISDYSGICNIQIPDINIFVIAPTNQNFEGSISVAKSIISSPYVLNGQFRKPTIIPILSRFDMSAKKDEIEHWINKFKVEYLFLFKNLFLPKRISDDLFQGLLNLMETKKLRMTFSNHYQKDNEYYNLNSQIDNRDSKVLLDFFISQKFITDYEKTVVLDYNKGLAFGENLLFDDNASTTNSINYISLAKNYEDIAVEFIEKIKEDKIFDFNKKIQLSKNYNVKNIRQLLDNAFTDEDLMIFTQNYFYDVYNSFSSGQPKSQKVMILLDYVLRRMQLDKLLEVLKSETPYQYEKFKPYEISKPLT